MKSPQIVWFSCYDYLPRYRVYPFEAEMLTQFLTSI